MMQSAAVLPTESPVKSLPEILGVPLQRKTFFFYHHFSVDYQSGNRLAGTTCAAGFRDSNSAEEAEPHSLRLSRTGQ